GTARDRDPRRHDPRRDGRRPVPGRRRDRRRPHRRRRHRAAGRRDRDRRHGPERGAGVRRSAQPLRLHAPRRPEGGERDPSGGSPRGRRQLRLRLLPGPRRRARAQGDLRLQPRRADRLDDGRRLLRAAAGGAAGRECAQPRAERPVAPGDRRARRAAGGTCRADGDEGAAARVARRGSLGLFDRARVRAGGGRDRGGGAGATEDEGAALCAAMAPEGGLYATHTRRRDEGAADSVAEAVRVARAAQARLQVSHLVPRNGIDESRRSMRIVEDSRADGLDVEFDMHTRLYGLTHLYAALPPWVLAEEPSRQAELLRDPAARARMRPHRSILSAGDDWSRIVLLDNPFWPEYARRDVAAVA